ncbi:MAG TPA: hypothetical protein VLD35_02410, partial [Caldimonas sp.]|nr:hypothetical protein [Caldimonas sp.]
VVPLLFAPMPGEVPVPEVEPAAVPLVESDVPLLVPPVLPVAAAPVPEPVPPAPPVCASARPPPQARAAAAARVRILEVCLMHISCCVMSLDADRQDAVSTHVRQSLCLEDIVGAALSANPYTR